ncbi:PREDICTED: uncharacterized protein LOC106331095 [Brassica oleracea var. oleracea]|uniref:uncharacterized protein LOC106331095 n=1 Tax=Brassica oleracea var. oleracea TaxID=109376 RepID=UPI0006A6DCC8|nr:PREDICTED: uncharacterized protein LOC106331095 [Brassica oleracea var. oleracea]
MDVIALKVQSLKRVWFPAGYRVTRIAVQRILNHGGSYRFLLIWKHNDEIVKNRRITGLLKSEIWGWTLFYAAVSGLAFGSGYYHLKPDDNGIVWDTLPVRFSHLSLCFSFRENNWNESSLSYIALFLFISFFNVAYARVFNDLRLYMTFQLIPCRAIPLITVLLPPKYTHSRFWLLATAAHSVSKINGYIIGGHSLGHLCSALAMLLLTVMLLYRSIRFQRLSELKGHL